MHEHKEIPNKYYRERYVSPRVRYFLIAIDNPVLNSSEEEEEIEDVSEGGTHSWFQN